MNQVVFIGFILLVSQCSFILTDIDATSTTKRYDTKPSDPTSTTDATTRYDTKATSKTTTIPQTKSTETTATTHTTSTKTTTTHKSGTTSHTEATNTTVPGTPTTHYTTGQTTTVMPTPDPLEPNAYQWTAKYSNETCFMAMAGLQFRASYKKTGENDPVPVHFDFSNATKVSSTNCSASTFKVMFIREERKQMLTFTFSKNKADYFLDMVELKFTVLNSTFPNSINLNKVVYAKSLSNMQLLSTPLGSSYSCSMETQVMFGGNETKANISGLFMRMTKISEFQAFTSADKKDPTKCFHDQSKPAATLGDWKVKNKDSVCARVKSVMLLRVGYFDVGKTQRNAEIPVVGDKVKVLSSSCTNNLTMMTLDLFQDQSINLTLTFTTDQSDKNYVLSDVTLAYRTTNPYFQNHEDFPAPVQLAPMSGLKWFPTPVGMSFRCDLYQEQVVVNKTGGFLSMRFKSNTQWEAFGIKKSGDFNEALYCPGEQSTTPSMTTQPITPPPINPKDPVVETFQVMDKKNKTCFLGNIGVQLRTNYFQNNESEPTEIGFNFMKNETMISGSCNGDTSDVIFFNNQRSQTIAMMFSRNKNNETFLSKVTVMYEITNSYFPNTNATVNPKKVNVTMSGMELFHAMKDSSYKCSKETDILVDHKHSVIVRILGVQLQAFNIENGKYSKASECFADTMKTTTGNTGDWWVKNEKNKTCARYQFASVVNITYPTLMGKDARTVFILDNSTSNSYGLCNNTSTLSLEIDSNTFTFFFNKTDEKGGVFNYEMMDFHVHYSVKSKYFPNHAYDSDGFVDLGNSSISLFQASSDHSYTCSAEVSVTFNMTNSISFKNVKVQPFGVTESGGFSKAEDCKADKDLSPVIPIVVGAVLAFLVVLVIVAYVIGRKRARSVEYESI